jgi:hypothetical protein
MPTQNQQVMQNEQEMQKQKQLHFQITYFRNKPSYLLQVVAVVAFAI